MIRPPQHHNADAVFPLQLIEHLPRTAANARLIILQRLVAHFDRAVILFLRQTHDGLARLHHLVRQLFAHQVLRAWRPIQGLAQDENDRAVEVGYKALEDYEASIRSRARQVLDQLEREDRIGIVMLGRPYHHDPGLNHEIMEEFQKLGYPIFSQNTLPLDEDMLERLFGEEVRAGIITHPLDITDAWKNSYSC